MPHNRIIPAVGVALVLPLVAWAQAPSQPSQPATPANPTLGVSNSSPGLEAKPAPKPEPPSEAELALDAAIKQVGALKSVSADITQSVEMLGQRFELRGNYLKAPEYRVYLKLSVSGLGDSSGDMVQVCDGKTLWDFQQILKTDRACTKLDISKVLKKLESPDFTAEIRKQAIERLGFAGPESLLAGLRNALRFYRKEPGTLNDKPVWVLYGEWKDMGALSGPNQPPVQAGAPLPPYIPSLAVVWIGKDDGWPYQVKLEGRQQTVLQDTREIGFDGRRVGRKDLSQHVEVSKILLMYSNVKLNPQLDNNTFVFNAPPDAPVTDLTDRELIGLEQAAAQLQAEQRAAAARESELPKGLSVPSPAPEIPSTIPKTGPAPLEKAPPR